METKGGPAGDVVGGPLPDRRLTGAGRVAVKTGRCVAAMRRFDPPPPLRNVIDLVPRRGDRRTQPPVSTRRRRHWPTNTAGASYPTVSTSFASPVARYGRAPLREAVIAAGRIEARCRHRIEAGHLPKAPLWLSQGR